MRFLNSFTLALVLFTNASLARGDASPKEENLQGGYFLLHDLLSNEADLPLLLDLKTAPKEIQDFAITISKTAKSELDEMDRMRANDPEMTWDKNPLPKIERDIRASITDEKQHQLLFGTKGPDFVRALLVSQAEASKYAANISKVLAEQDPAHAREFGRMSARWHALYEEDFRLLRNY